MQQDLVCRGCLAVEGKFSYIHDFATAQSYENLFGIPLSLSDGLPEHLCMFCLRTLHKFAKFKLKCLKALDILHQARVDGRLVTKEYSCSVTSHYPELKPQYIKTKTFTLEILKQDDDDLMDSPVVVTLEVDKEEKLSDNETEDFFSNNDIIEPKHESDNEFTAKPYEVFVDDFNNVLNNKKKNNHRKVKPKRKPIEPKDKVKKRYVRKNRKSKSDRQIVIDYAKSTGFDIAFLTHEEQIKEIEEKKNEITSGHDCRQCGKHFDAADALERHEKNYHVLQPGCFMCDICSCVFKNKRTLRSHMTSHSWVFSCQSCSFRTKQRPVLRKHQHFHEGKRFPCNYCGKEFTKTTSYFSHVRLTHASELSWCDLCGEFFIGSKGVENHKKLTHNMAEEFPNACRCDKRFKSEEALERHIDVKGCSLPSCAQCGERFPHEHLLKYHLVQRHVRGAAPASFPCERCRLRFHSRAARAAHACGGAGAACAQCGEGLPDHAALVEHFKLRHDIFKCEECGKQFTNSAYFKRHYSLLHASAGRRARGRKPLAHQKTAVGGARRPRAHAAVRRWRVAADRALVVERLAADGARLVRDDAHMTSMCEVCGKKFRNETELRTHQRFHSAESRFSCALCRKGFKQRAQLQMHERVHTGERPYQCPECPKAFKTHQGYTRHYLIHSGLRKHVCQLCEKSFQTSTAAKMHIKSVHMKLPMPPRVRHRRHKEPCTE